VRKDLEREVAGCTLVKEAATIAKYRVEGVAAPLQVSRQHPLEGKAAVYCLRMACRKPG
jgi:hypothetical protein